MTAARRRLRCGVVAVALAALAVFLAPAPSAQAESNTSVTDYLGCLVGQGGGDLLILFDTTGSLERTDPLDKAYPHGRRADAAKALVAELGSFARAKHVDLDVAMTGFGAIYDPEGDWVSLSDQAGVPKLDAKIDAVSSITNAYESDFWTALSGAQAALQQRAQTEAAGEKPGARRCQALLWFTDGRFHLQQRTKPTQWATWGFDKPYARGEQYDLRQAGNVKRVAEMGERAICADNTGPADQLRAGNVTIWAVGLKPQGSTEDLSILKAVARGEDDQGRPCGRLRTPPGQYFEVDDVAQFVQTIWTAVHPDYQRLQRFVLDDALSSVSIAAHQSTGQGLRLAGPASVGSVDIMPGQPGNDVEFGSSGVTASWRWDSPESLTVEVDRGEGSWLGVWSIDTLDGRPANPNDLQVSFRGDLIPSVTTDDLVTGRTADVRLGLRRSDQTAVPTADVPGTIGLDAQLERAGQAPRTIVRGATLQTLDQPRSLDLRGFPAGPASIRLTLRYTTQQVDGLSTTLAPQVVIVPVDVAPPSGRVLGAFDFGAVTGAADSTAQVSVEGPACVWLTPVSADPSHADPNGPLLVGPEAVGTVTVTAVHHSADTCLVVPAKQTIQFPAQLRTTGPTADGGLRGQVLLNLAPPSGPGKATTAAVDFQAELSPAPVDLGRSVPVFIAVFLAGLAIPIGLLYVLKWRGAKIPPHPLEAVRVPIAVTDGQVVHAGRTLTQQSLPTPEAVSLLRKGTRETTAAGVWLRTRMGAKPFGAGFVEASLPGQVGGSSAHEGPHGKSGAAKLPLAVHNTWALLHDPRGPANEGTLLLLRGLDLDDAGSAELLADARRRVPDLLSTLRSQTGAPMSELPGEAGQAAAGDFGLGTSAGPRPAAAGFGLGVSSSAGASPSRTRPAPAQPAPTGPTSGPTGAPADPDGLPADPDDPPNWDSQSFGSFGLETESVVNRPDDTPGERKAP